MLASWKEAAARAIAGVLPGQSPGARPSVGAWILRGILVGALTVFFLPSAFFIPPSFGAEPSWRLFLNQGFSEGWAFGERLVWTYGPLAFLETRYPCGVSPFYLIVYDVVVMLLFFRLALDAVRARLDPLAGFAALLCLFTCKRLLNDQPSSALFCLVIYLILLNLSRPGILAAAALVVLSVTSLFVKLNFGLVGVFLTAAVLVFKAMGRERAAWRWLALLAIQCLLAAILARWLNINLAAYVKASFAVVRHYHDAMAWGPRPDWMNRGFGVAHAAVCLFAEAFAVLAVRSLWRRGFSRPAVLCLFLAAAAVFILYKTSVVRSDYNHNKCFLLAFPLLALAFLLHCPEALRALWRPLFLGSSFYAGLLMVAEFGNALIYLQPEYLSSFLPVNYARGIRDYHLLADWKDYARYVNQRYPERVVPESVRHLIGTNRVDVFPFEATLALGSGLDYQPRPIPQSYGVIGQAAEDRNVAWMNSPMAPQFVLLVLGDKGYTVDGRYFLWDEPAVRRLIRQNYNCLTVFTNLQGAQPESEPKMSPVMVMQRKPRPADSLPETMERAVQRVGAEFPVPQEGDEVYARIRFRKTLLGRLVSFLYRGAPVSCRFSLADGTQRTLRVIPPSLESGVLVNYFAEIANPESAANYFCRQSRGNPRCLRLKFDCERPWEYQPEVELTYFRQK